MHQPILHLPLILRPPDRFAAINCCIQDAPSIGFIQGPLPLVLDSAIAEEELSFSMHQIIFPTAFVVTPIFEDIFTSAMFEIVLLLADVLVAICVLFMHVDYVFCLVD